MDRITRLLIVTSLLGAASMARATGVADDFESYAVGTFPSSQWSDAGAFMPIPPVASLPSATVVSTTDAFGNPTQALAVTDQVAAVSGIYQAVPLSSQYSLAADMRVDRYSNNPDTVTTDWAMQLTFAQLTRTFYNTPQAGIFASSLTQGWRVFLIDSTDTVFADIDLGVAATTGTWYRVGFDLDAGTGAYRVRITDIATSTLLTDTSGVFAGWTADSGRFDAVSFFDGEGSPTATIGNLALVDNINVEATPVPEPSSALLLALGLGGVAAALRRRALQPSS
jgi:hypothetical protein